MFFVRTASKRDVEQIRDVLVQAWHATYDSIHGSERVNEIISEWHSTEQIIKNLDSQYSEYLVADDGKQIGGMCFATQHKKLINLHQLYVLPELQGQKIGLNLLIEIENAFMDCDTIGLEVDEKNEAAINFYKAYGFEMTGITENCGKNDSGIRALLMNKRIIYADD